MSKNTFSVSAFIIASLLLAPSLALAKNSSYVSLQVGGAVPNSKLTHDTADVGLKKKSPKNAAAFNINAGTEVWANTYAELELAYGDHKLENNYVDIRESAPAGTLFKTRVKTMSGFANLSYRFANVNMTVIPYITAGVGISSNKVKNMTFTIPVNHLVDLSSPGKTTTQAAWQIGGGLLMPISKNISLNLGYKYRDLGKVKTSSRLVASNGLSGTATSPILQGRMRTSNILLGATINF